MDGHQSKQLMIRDARHPFVLSIIGACLISGLVGVLLPSDPHSSIVDRYVPEPWRTIFYTTLAASSFVILVGVWLPDFRDRLMVEQIGLWFLTAVLLLYPILIWAWSSYRLNLGGMIPLLCGLGGLVRILEIRRELRSWYRLRQR